MDTQARCYFVDVGQGTCQIICLGEGRAIVIDTGARCARRESRKSIVSILQVLKVSTIEALILSHNDDDHIGQATTILTTYRSETQSEVRSAWLLQDRPVQSTQSFERLTTCLEQSQKIGCRVGCLANDSEPRILFEDSKKSLVLKVIYPPFLQTLATQANGNSNEACAILRLDVGKSKILFTGDASFGVLKYIHQKFGILASDVMSVPHHGSDMDIPDEWLSWVYGTALNATFAVISAGTTNRYGHPAEKVVRLIRQSGAEILCTQMSQKCSDCLSACRQQRGTFNLDISRSQSKPPPKGKGVSTHSNIACCGTIAVDIGIDSIEILHLARFRDWKSQLPLRLCF